MLATPSCQTVISASAAGQTHTHTSTHKEVGERNTLKFDSSSPYRHVEADSCVSREECMSVSLGVCVVGRGMNVLLECLQAAREKESMESERGIR